MKKKFLILLLSGLVTGGVCVAKEKHNILTVNDVFDDTTTIVPSSFETDTENLLQNWYLQNYTVLDEDVESKSSNEATEEEYIKRLSQIPSVIEMPYNSEVRRFIDLYITKKRTLVEAMLGMSLYYMPIFEQALEQEGLPLELKYLPVVESALDPVAKSREGAAGLWQFMVRTGKGLGLEINSLVDERLDPYKSSVKAAKYLKQLHNIYKDWSLAIAAYNCGPGKVNQAIRNAGGTGKDFWQIYAFLPKETRGYVPAFIAANYAMTYFKYHNISPALAKKPIVVDTVTVNRRIHFNQIANVLNMPIEAIRVLNPQYRKDVIPGNSRPYTLALPSQQIYSFMMSIDSIYKNDASKYQPRLVVEPQMEQIASDEKGEYTYETRTVTKYHTIRKGESLGKIARKYGTSVSAIKSANNLRSNNLTAGKRLKIKVKEQVKVYRPVEEDSAEEIAEADSLALQAAVSDNSSTSKKEKDEKPKDKKPKKEKAKEEAEPKRKEVASNYTGTHRVQSGESLYIVAQKYGVTVSDLKDANNLSSNNLKVGQKLKVPQAGKKADNTNSSSTHIVRSGESLYLIAERYGITVNELKKANSIADNKIKPGLKLTIPQKKAVAKTSRSKVKSSKRNR